MKILLVHPGASWSTHDVWAGIHGALERAGVQVVDYALDGRVAYAQAWFKFMKRRKRVIDYSIQDVMYEASTGVLQRALHHEVDWVLIVSGTFLQPHAAQLYRRAGLKVCSILTESPYQMEQEDMVARFSDIVWTNERTCVEHFAGITETHYWQHAYDPAKHYTGDDADMDDSQPKHDVVFVGTGWQERCDLLGAVDWTGIDLGLYGSWDLLGSRNKLRQYVRGGIVPNELTAALYRNAAIGINLHRSSVFYGKDMPKVSGAESMNPRCYELAATGCFFVSDAREELAEVFGTAVPTFRNAEELGAMIRRYLDDPAERGRLAALARERVAEHTFDARIKSLLAVMERHDGEVSR